MKPMHVVALAATLAACFYTSGWETFHTETDKPGVFSGQTHEETTTTHNPIKNTDDKIQSQTKAP